MDGKSDEEISLFVRDGRFLFNANALQALRINPVEAQQRGYPLKEVAGSVHGGHRSHARSTAKRLRSASEQ